MNNWQIKYIANNTSSSDKGAVMSKQYWKDFALANYSTKNLKAF